MDISAVIDKVHGLLLNNIPIKTSTSRKGWITMSCAVCTDTRGRAGIKQTGARISYHCFNCSITAGWSPGYALTKNYRLLLDTLQCNTADINEVQLLLLKHNDRLNEINDSNTVYAAKELNFPQVDLPDYSVSIENLSENHPVRLYAETRGIYGIYPLFFVEKTLKYKNRLLIPYFFNDVLVGWTSRHICPPNKTFPKYLNESPSNFVFNVDQFTGNERECVIVVEGVIDALAIDGIGVIGNELSPEQAHLIQRLNKRIILCPDQDEAGKLLTEQAIKLGWEISFPPWEGVHDAAGACNKYGRLLTVSSIMKYTTSNLIKAKIKSNLL